MDDESFVNYRRHLDVAAAALGQAQQRGWSRHRLCEARQYRNVEFGAEKVLLQGHARRQVARGFKKLWAFLRLSAKPFHRTGEEGMDRCCKLLGVGSFVQLSTRVRIVRSQVPLNFHQNKLYSLSWNFLYKGIYIKVYMTLNGHGQEREGEALSSVSKPLCGF